VLVAFMGGCVDGGKTRSGGSGGQSATGGATSSGGSGSGSSATGGSSGGSAGSGGRTGTGGTPAAGGSSSTGTTSSGGATGSGGSFSAGGTTGTGGAPPTGGARTGGATATGGARTGGATGTGGMGTGGAASGGRGGGTGGVGTTGSGGGAGTGGAGSGGRGGTGGAGTTGSGGAGGGTGCPLPTTFKWSSSGALVNPKSNATHNIVSVKDPTVVFFNNRWHIYATTADTAGSWSMAYINFADWPEANAGTHYYLDQTPSLAGYHCAPHLFYFRPQSKWYLIYQSQHPQYSTADDPSQPGSWTQPRNFFATTPSGVPDGWLDYWVICDDANCHLFFTGDNGSVYRSQTTIQSFPSGMSNPVVAMQDERNNLFEGSSHYRVKGTNQYLTLVEAIGSGFRYYRAFVADRLDGQWTALAATESNPFAGRGNVSYPSGVADWTDDISHGELIRDGNDETATVDPCNLRFLYQGLDPAMSSLSYSQLPYRLGLLTKTN